jgi:hypothetical protein
MWFSDRLRSDRSCNGVTSGTQRLKDYVVATDGVFLQADVHLVLMGQTPYDTGSVLQQLLASYPEVIAGSTTEGDEEPRLLLVRREVPVPSTDGGGRTWTLDHLFIDAEGVPVLVEVKRSSDTRIRREYVGQMLDYAANAVRYWPLAVLRQWLQQRAEERSSEAGELLTEENLLAELRPDVDPLEFWKAVETNLSAGRIRMLFVADELPDELVRIIEFLNEQMNPAEVLTPPTSAVNRYGTGLDAELSDITHTRNPARKRYWTACVRRSGSRSRLGRR